MITFIGFIAGVLLGGIAGIPYWFEGRAEGYLVLLGCGVMGAILLPLMDKASR